MIYGLVFASLAFSANAFTPQSRLMARASNLKMASTMSPATTVLATAARDARGLAIDSISAVIKILLFKYFFPYQT